MAITPIGDAQTLRLPARIDQLDDALAFVDAILEAGGAPMAVSTAVDIAVEEIFVNIAHYAYPGRDDGEALLTCWIDPDPRRVCVRFEDWGVPYDPLAKPDPDISKSAEERKIGGLGIYMVKKSMSEVAYAYEGRNVFTIAKNCQK